MPRRVLTGYLAAQAALGAAVFAVPSLAALWWGAIGAVTVAAVGWGIRRHRPPRRRPWLLLAAGAAALAVGDVCYELSLLVSGAAGDWLAGLAEIAYLATFGLLAAGVLSLTRATVALRDRSGLLDTLVLVLVVGLVAWTVLIGPVVADVDVPAAEKALRVVHSLGGVLVLVAMLRLAAVAWRDPTVVGLTVGAAGILAADVAYAVAELGDGWRPGGPAELGWFVFYVAWGLAALHPFMARLATVTPPGPDEVAATRVGLVTLTCLTVPVLLVIQAFAAGPTLLTDGLVAAAVAGLATLLAATRVADSVSGHRAALDRERSLRQAGSRLLAAATVGEVAVAVRESAARLLPAGIHYDLLFAVRRPESDPGLVDVADWQPQLAIDHPLPVDAVDRRTRIVPARLLHPELAGRFATAPAVLVASLAAPEPTAGSGTALLVAADPEALVAAKDAVEVLAAQAALTVHRIAATEEAARRDRDRYLDLAVGGAGDAVLVIGADDRIRYASPPVGRLLGVEPPLLAHWREVVHPDDHAQVARTLAAAADRAGRDTAGADRAGTAAAGADGTGVGAQWVLRRPDGSHVLLEVRCRDLRQVPGVRGLVLTMSDVADQRRYESELARRRLDRSAPGRNRRSLRDRFR
ncbi:PAS domain-containing protein [Solwaraspora sp. WMMD791]|uniref:PAS domain-containing protein n=1 Tax=Solwaraspora sp. WMMD791 TaxID=3016086 RepID=UPI002499C87D|nr:PAS domain-containing protein [Solwaraspora sp. WMMD791]WFE26584.1 PAS domain-containing protein [Solwaraspora sp. WMMD791]